MPSSKKTALKDLYKANSVSELNSLAGFKAEKTTSLNALSKSADKVFLKAQDFDMINDEEMAYVFFMRYFNIICHIKKSPQYQKEKLYYDKFLGETKPKKAIIQAEKLQSSLLKRYEERQKMKEDEELAQKLAARVVEKYENQPKEKIKQVEPSSVNEDLDSLLDGPAISAPSDIFQKLKVDHSSILTPQGSNVSNGLHDANTLIPDLSEATPFCTAEQLYSYMKKSFSDLLIIDIRPLKEYAKNHIRHESSINIPAEYLEHGVSVSNIDRRIPERTRLVWCKRGTKNHIIILDKSSRVKELSPASKLYQFKEAIFRYDSSLLKTEPLFLDGGFDGWLWHYPGLATSPELPMVLPSAKLNEFVDVSSLEFPEIPEEKITPPALVQTHFEHLVNKKEITEPNELYPQPQVSGHPTVSSSQSQGSMHPLVPPSQSQIPGHPIVPPSQSQIPGHPVVPSSQSQIPGQQVVPSSQSQGPTHLILPSSQPQIPGHPIVPSSQYQGPTHSIVPSSQSQIPGHSIVSSSQSQGPTHPVGSSSQSQIPGHSIVPSSQSQGPIHPVVSSRQSQIPGHPIVPSSQSQVPGPPTLPSSQSQGPEHLIVPSSQSPIPGHSNVPSSPSQIPTHPVVSSSQSQIPGHPIVPSSQSQVPGTLPASQSQLPGHPTLPASQPKLPGHLPGASQSQIPTTRNPPSFSSEQSVVPGQHVPSTPFQVSTTSVSQSRGVQEDENLSTSGLPPGWEKCYDKASNRVYFKDHTSQTTHWNLPDSALPLTPQVQKLPGSPKTTRKSAVLKQQMPQQPTLTRQMLQSPIPKQDRVLPTPQSSMKPQGETPHKGPVETTKSTLRRSLSSPNLAKLEDCEPIIDRSSKPVQSNFQKPSFNRNTKPLTTLRLESLNPVRGGIGSGLTGLRNLGNTCYMNSVLQCLFSAAPLAAYFLSGAFRDDLNLKNPMGTRGELAEQFSFLVSVTNSGHYKSISPTDFKKIIGKIKLSFSGFDQQDSQEFLTLMMDKLHEDVNKVTKKPYFPAPEENLDPRVAAEKAWSNHKKRNESIMLELFDGLFMSTVHCTTCGKESVTFETFSNLTLPLPTNSNHCSLMDCLKLFTHPEKMFGEDKWFCPKCKQHREAIKRMQIWRLPPILIIHLKRFQYDGMWRQKLQTSVSFPIENLDMTGFVTGPKSSSYNLFSVSNHYGTMHGGHYTAFCNNSHDKRWYKFDDQLVTQISNKNNVVVRDDSSSLGDTL